MRHPDAACRSGVATQIDMKIYTDGGCDRNGHPDAIGAWAFVASDGHEDFGVSEPGATSSRMELLAVIKALEYAGAQYAPWVTIYSASKRTVFCATGKHHQQENLDLWGRFSMTAVDTQKKFVWARRDGVAGSDRAYGLCRAAMASARQTPEIAHLRSILRG